MPDSVAMNILLLLPSLFAKRTSPKAVTNLSDYPN